MFLFAHRGDSLHAPENTCAAFRMAKQKGANWVEFDVILTKDHQAIVFHDQTLNRTTNGKGYVNRSTLEYILSLDAGKWFDAKFTGERVPTLQEILLLLNELDLNANIEIKPYDDAVLETVETVLSLVESHWPINKPWPLISSFDHRVLDYSLKRNPKIPRGCLLPHWRDDCCELAKKSKSISLHLPYRELNQQRIKLVKSCGLLIYTYTVDDLNKITQLSNWGVDAIFTNNPMILD